MQRAARNYTAIHLFIIFTPYSVHQIVIVLAPVLINLLVAIGNAAAMQIGNQLT